jgi:hypothetical protein
MNGIRKGVYRFMSGRYGNDALNNFMLISVTIVMILNSILINNSYISILVEIIIVFIIYRSLSRNFSKRYLENNAYMKYGRLIKKRFVLIKKQIIDLKHRYYICPNCNQIVRVPKGKGKIVVTCSKCRTKFEKRS